MRPGSRMTKLYGATHTENARMKLLEKDRPATRRAHAAAPRPVASPRSLAKPIVVVRARVVSRPAPYRHARRDAALNAVVAFAAVVGLTYVGSTLAGYVVLERARQSARHADARASYARSEAQSARTSIEALTNPAVLRTWAETHGFASAHPALAPTPDAKGSDLVARR